MSSGAGELRVAASAADAQVACASFLEDAIADTIARHGKAAIALSGGSTPWPTYERLAASTRVDWRRVDVFFADERCVPPDHADSNFRMVSAAFGGTPARIVRMVGEMGESGAADYARLLPPKLDLVLLGMGADGHTASLFPGKPSVLSSGQVLFVNDSPKPPPARLTLGRSVLEHATQLVMLVTGADKAKALAKARDAKTAVEDIPARLARRGIWFVDEAAAKGQ